MVEGTQRHVHAKFGTCRGNSLYHLLILVKLYSKSLLLNVLWSSAHVLHNLIIVNEAKSFQMPLPNFFVLDVICDHALFNIGQFGANNVFRCGARMRCII